MISLNFLAFFLIHGYTVSKNRNGNHVMDRTFQYLILPGEEGLTIEQYLRSKGYSHHILTHLKRTHMGICLNNSWAYANQRLSPGDILRILLTEEGSDAIPATPVPFSIVYEDEDFLVIDKPAGIPVHPSIGNYNNTLANGIVLYFQQKGEAFTFRCINRLDRDTTGLLIIARHALAGALLSSMMSRREISRTYEALVFGSTPPAGTITLPIGRKEGSVIERIPDPVNGAPAVTHYQTLFSGCSFSHIRLKLETGRTHQIRVHMTAVGHPLLGDTLYAPSAVHPIDRQALHSAVLEFRHPFTGRFMHFFSPLPDDMQTLLDQL